VENEDQESWIKNETGKDKSWLKFQEAKEECRSCEVHIATIDHLQSKRKKDKEKKRELTQKCDNLQKKYDDSRKECDDLLRKRISDIYEMNTLQKNVVSIMSC
jgi:FtsZ-binding cell division protein ZapB